MSHNGENADGHEGTQLRPPSKLAWSFNTRRLSLGGFEPSFQRSPSRLTRLLHYFRSCIAGHTRGSGASFVTIHGLVRLAN